MSMLPKLSDNPSVNNNSQHEKSKKIGDGCLRIIKLLSTHSQAFFIIAGLVTFLIANLFPLFYPDLVENDSNYWQVLALSISLICAIVFMIVISPIYFDFFTTNLLKGPLRRKLNSTIDKEQTRHIALFWIYPNLALMILIVMWIVFNLPYSVPVTLLGLPLLTSTIICFFNHRIIFKTLKKRTKGLKPYSILFYALFQYFFLYFFSTIFLIIMMFLIEKTIPTTEIQNNKFAYVILLLSSTMLLHFISSALITLNNKDYSKNFRILISIPIIAIILITLGEFYKPILIPVLKQQHLGYFSDYNYIFDKPTCKNLKQQNINITMLDKKQCVLNGRYEIKSAIGQSIKIIFNKNTLDENEITIKKLHIKSRISHVNHYPNKTQLSTLAKAYIRINSLPSLAISLYGSDKQEALSIFESYNSDNKSNPTQLKFTLDNAGQGIIIGLLMIKTNDLIGLQDKVNLYYPDSPYGNKTLMDLFIHGRAKNQQDQYQYVKHIFERSLNKTYISCDEKIDNLVPSYVLKSATKIPKSEMLKINDQIYVKKYNHDFKKYTLCSTLPTLVKQFNHIAHKQELTKDLEKIGYVKQILINNQPVVVLESHTISHQILLFYFINQHDSIGLATNTDGQSLSLSNPTIQRLIINIRNISS